jgi:hypothetical protein
MDSACILALVVKWDSVKKKNMALYGGILNTKMVITSL